MPAKSSTMYTLNCSGRLLKLDNPVVMGIINATPDSFFADSRVSLVEAGVAKAVAMDDAGATFLDIGGQSTRPGAAKVSPAEEADRVLPLIAAVKAALPHCFISVDTFYASVARQAVEAGACMVNDVSGGLADADMLPVVGAMGVPYVCMHMRGTHQNMQQLTEYDDVVTDVLDYFISRIGRCRAAGIKDVVADVGIGFSKTITQNFTLLRHLDTFHVLGVPLLIGVSRKSLIYRSLNIRPEEALNGSTVLHTVALQNGAHILRTHDVKEAVETIELLRMVQQPEPHMAW